MTEYKLVPVEPTREMERALHDARADDIGSIQALRLAIDAAPSLNPWVSVKEMPDTLLGKMVLLDGGLWRHPFYGQVVDKETGECVLDNPHYGFNPQSPAPANLATRYLDESILPIPKPEDK